MSFIVRKSAAVVVSPAPLAKRVRVIVRQRPAHHDRIRESVVPESIAKLGRVPQHDRDIGHRWLDVAAVVVTLYQVLPLLPWRTSSCLAVALSFFFASRRVASTARAPTLLMFFTLAIKSPSMSGGKSAAAMRSMMAAVALMSPAVSL